MKHCLLYLLTLVGFVVSCTRPGTQENVPEADVAVDSLASDAAFTQDDQANIQHLIQLTLQDEYKEDLEKGWVDSLSRQFKYSQIDLNEDGKLEILVGMTGPYFCGSGGCTVFLLTNHGDIITLFSVVDYPAYVANEASQGWKNLILYSGGHYRVVPFDATAYPSNPSTLDIYPGNVDQLTKVLDWENLAPTNF